MSESKAVVTETIEVHMCSHGTYSFGKAPCQFCDLKGRLWQALGKWSVEICNPAAELAPPQYLIDAVDALAGESKDGVLPEPVAQPGHEIHMCGGGLAFGKAPCQFCPTNESNAHASTAALVGTAPSQEDVGQGEHGHPDAVAPQANALSQSERFFKDAPSPSDAPPRQWRDPAATPQQIGELMEKHHLLGSGMERYGPRVRAALFEAYVMGATSPSASARVRNIMLDQLPSILRFAELGDLAPLRNFVHATKQCTCGTDPRSDPGAHDISCPLAV